MEKDLKQRYSKVIKVTMYGPESTGKTTLSKQLAEHFKTIWIPEYARNYLQQKWEEQQAICDENDMLPIAIGQMKLENEAVQIASKLLFCDTNLMVTKVFSEIYYGFCDELLNDAAREHNYDLFFLTDVDVPWEKDDLRDRPEKREETFRIFENALIENNKPYIVLSGNKQQRFETAVKAVEMLLKTKSLGFTSADFLQMWHRGTNIDAIERQLKFFNEGIAKINLHKIATVGDGIRLFDKEQEQELVGYFEAHQKMFSIEKLVPASGAASRMFKFLVDFLNEFKLHDETINAYVNRKKASELSVFLVGIEKFPFYADVLQETKSEYKDFDNFSQDEKYYRFIETMLSPAKFDFLNKPKGILPFHQEKEAITTPIFKHLKEAQVYTNVDGNHHIHFTVSEEHLESFSEVVLNSENTVNVSYSFQDKATDTLAVSVDNEPFRLEDGSLFFRPGGHGALIQNLNRLKSDIVFVKNIDNVCFNHFDGIVWYKKLLGGLLMRLQKQIFDSLKMLETTTDPAVIQEIIAFTTGELNIVLPRNFSKYTFENQKNQLFQLLNRPIRVCGMVKNEGEPGGGPFWVTGEEGMHSLQIVESSQIDLQNKKQALILSESTHFNPVDLVCGLKDYKGEKFNLENYVDHNTGFIVNKTKGCKDIKAYELPGLWNGSMANWITVFVEVPLLTFNPVKTVNDLLKPAHQPR
ncbi:DUF4301 family protein [Flavobacterium supellecticarium]|uniref:DUF4301 family protein n=1 Tax=Flavobacterium supellecticarium TaxID=2565924 RepID=A0A4S3ZSY2_9FLAO|nr:DUF4301 family protein [Flavobacterium supellecticarium]THF48789.1 DUF4301 family protein [Flavobacterium supellecticarium]